MVKRNKHIEKLQGGYLFPEINRRKNAYLAEHPGTQFINLGIGDTTEPIPPSIVKGLVHGAAKLGTREGYNGYGPEQGQKTLREKIAHTFYQGMINADEIFVSDGSKCDIGRLQLLFGSDCTISVQDPSYPVYVDTSVTLGQTDAHNGSGYEGIAYLPCSPENNFFPDLEKAPKTDLIYFCSPNNPTGAAATREQLKQLVAFAKKNHSILIFDAAYASYIRSVDCPKTIYEIEGAKEVAIELNSFSKMAGFTGVRLAWSVVPEALKFDNGQSVRTDWLRIATTFFNGASNIAQEGALAALEQTGLAEMLLQTDYYLQNAKLIKKSFLELGYPVFGADHAPYVWVQFPGQKSWDVFQSLLEKCHVVATPGAGFGPKGEGFMRFSAFCNREQTQVALDRIAALE